MSLRLVFRRSTWQSLWVALRRAPKDARARKQLRPIIAWSLQATYLIVWGTIVFWPSKDKTRGQTIFQATFYAVFFVSIRLYVWWENRRDYRLAEEKSPAVLPEIKVAIYREARLLAVLLERLGSERLLEKEIPDHITIITRRVLLDQLRQQGLLEGLEAPYLNLLLAQDGHWESGQKRQVEQLWEYLAVLRWVLGLGELRPLALLPEYSLAMAKEIADVRSPKELQVLPSWDIRPERNDTDEFFERCWIELLARGEASVDSPEIMERAIQIREEIQDIRNDEDYVVGVQTLSEASKELLWEKSVRAYRRLEILSLLVDITSGDKAAGELHQLVLDFVMHSHEKSTSVEE